MLLTCPPSLQSGSHRPAAGAEVALSPDELARYSRHLLLGDVGPAGQEKLKAARVLIVGVGGLGSPAALYLAAAGVGQLGLLDCDRVDVSNLQRQVLFDTAGIGQTKAAIARERLIALNPHISVIAHDVELRAANAAALFADYDIIVDGSDRIGTRYLVNDACVLLHKILVTAAIHRFEGQAMTYVPERGPCYRCLFPQAGEVASCAEAGVLGVLPGVLGTLQATEVIKLIVGIGAPLLGRLLTYDALALRFREFGCARRVDCAVCGTHPSITALHDAPAAPSQAQLRAVNAITVQQLQALLRHADRAAPLLVDVRESAEFAAGHLPGARNIPLGMLDAALAQLPRDRSIVFMCRSGARSRQACALAMQAGMPAALQLEGGLLAWAQSIDVGLTVS
jgi:molybdopterin/thiamine biosynthesis adenylyltransferase/rhodanese-related sulfurtransferase